MIDKQDSCAPKDALFYRFLTPLGSWSCFVHRWCCPRMCSSREGYAMDLHHLRQEQIKAQTFRFNSTVIKPALPVTTDEKNSDMCQCLNIYECDAPSYCTLLYSNGQCIKVVVGSRSYTLAQTMINPIISLLAT